MDNARVFEPVLDLNYNLYSALFDMQAAIEGGHILRMKSALAVILAELNKVDQSLITGEIIDLINQTIQKAYSSKDDEIRNLYGKITDRFEYILELKRIYDRGGITISEPTIVEG